MNPFSTGPLNFSKESNINALIKAKHLHFLRGIYTGLDEEEFSRIYIIAGDRGSGKSTSLKYLDYLTWGRERNVGSILCDCPVNKTDLEKLNVLIPARILKSLLEFMGRDSQIRENLWQFQSSDLPKHHKYLESNDSFQIENSIITLLEKISKVYNYVLISIDNLDKIEVSDWEIFNNYFTQNQGFIEKILNVGNFKSVCVLISMHKYMVKNISKQDSYLKGDIIDIPKWEYQHSKNLILKRLEVASRQKKFKHKYFITDEVLRMIYIKSNGNPRSAIILTGNLLNKAYEINEQERLGRKALEPKFVKKYLSEIIGSDTISRFATLQKIDEDLLRYFHRTSINLEKCIKDNPNQAYELGKLLIELSIGKNKKILDKSLRLKEKEIIDILIECNLILSSKKKKVTVYKLTQKAKKMMNFISMKLNNDKNLMLNYMITKFM